MVTLLICVFCIDAFHFPINKHLKAKTDRPKQGYCKPRLPLHMVSPLTQDVNTDASQSANGESVPQIETAILKSIAQPNKPSSRSLPTNWLGEKGYILSTAALIGLTTGTNIALFKKAVEYVREILYGDGVDLSWLNFGGGATIEGEFMFKLSETIPCALAPAVGGLLMGALLKFGGEMPPGLRDTVTEG